jgi:prepilin-type N-terminal cleavage/methylation domain-containing protein
MVNLKKNKSENGFTIIEMIFVVMIFAILSTIAFFNFGIFSARISFDNLTQDVALKIIQAQKNAMLGAVNSNFITRDMKPTYGIYFTVGSSTAIAVSNNQFISFTDIPASGTTTGNKLYDVPTNPNYSCNTSGSPECISVTQINTGEYVDEICYNSPMGGLTCNAKDVHIVFTRPLPDASILYRTSFAATTYFNSGYVCIELTSLNDPDSKRTIKVNSFGQVQTYNLSATSTISGTNICS